MKTATIKHYKITGISFLAYVVLFLTGYFILMGAFNFPDILREDAVTRFTLFHENREVIVPTYYLVGFTSIIQIFMAVMFFYITKSGRLADIFTLVAGVLAGAFQILGFYRWVVLIPMLSNAYQNGEVANETIFMLEKFANTYLGMTVGEHFGNFFVALWLIGAAVVLMKSQVFDKGVVIFTWVAGGMMLINAYEPFSGVHAIFEPLAPFVIAFWAFYYTWLIVISINMLIVKKVDQKLKTPMVVWGVGAVYFVSNVMPVFMG